MADRSKLVRIVYSIHEVTMSLQRIPGQFEIVLSFPQISFCLRTNRVRKLYNTINLLVFKIFGMLRVIFKQV